MKDQSKTKQVLIQELSSLKQRIAELEQAESERKRAEEELREGEERFRSLIQSLSDMIFVIDRNGQFTYESPSVSRILGFQPGHFIGKSPFTHIHPDDLDTVVKDLDEVVQEVNPGLPTAFRYQKADNTWVYLEALGNNQYDNPGIQGVVITARDITERKRVESAFRKSEAEKTVILESVSDMIFYIDTDMRVIYSNLAVEKFFNLPFGSLGGKVCYNALHHRDKPCSVCPALRAMQSGKPHESLISSFGRHWRLSGYPVRDENGIIVGAIEAVSDITDLRKAEEKYRSIFDNAMEGIYQSTLDGSLISVNPALARIFGYDSPETMMSEVTSVGRSLYADPDRRQAFLRLVEEQGIAKNFEFEGLKKDGENIYVSDNGRAVKDSKNNTLYYEGIIQDITDRKRVEESLRESEERYRNVFENHAAVKLLINPDTGSIIEANEAAVNYYGWSHERLKQMKIQEINALSPEDVNKEMEKARTKKRINFEFSHQRADGSIRDVEVFSSKINIKGKDLLHSIIHDITERKQIEESLRDSEARYTLIMNNITDRIWLSDMSFKLIWASESVTRDRGYHLKEMNPFSFEKLLTPDSLETVLNTISKELTPQRLQQKDLDISKTLDLEFLRKDGSSFWSEVKMLVLRDHDGTPSSILGIGRDITERKRAEDSLRESEERFRALSENAPDIIYTMNLEGAVTYANPSWKRVLGHDEEDLRGRYFTDFTNEVDRKTYRKLFKSIREDGKIVSNYIGVMLTKDGAERVFNMNSAFIRDSKGCIIGVVGTMKDITEQREMEKKLSQAQKMEAIGTLAGGIAHDFNNLLMGIQGYASLMLLDMDASHPHYDRLKRIEQQVQHGADLTKQLLGFARGGRYEVMPTDMNDIIDRTSSMFGRTKKEISVHRSLAEDLWAVDCDQGQMEQVLMNLYVNAWQAMPGGGELYLQTGNVMLGDDPAMSYTIKPGRYVKVSITDTGTGMDGKTLERIFDPFFTTKAMGRGTGLGLAMVYGIIKGHTGMIDVTSEPGQGTTFYIYLPASDKTIVQEKPAVTEILTGTETVLLVDDEQMVLDVTRELLESLGYRVYAVGSGQEAIAVYMEKRTEIDMVILDMIMPGISGGEAFERLREIDPEIRVLLSSGYSINGQAREILERGCNGFLQKPFQLEKLSRKVREVLSE
jgi:PAS domain S-box-containing protein